MEFEEEIRSHPMWKEIQEFLGKRGIQVDRSRTLLYVVSMMSGFLIYRFIKDQAKLPILRPNEEKADESRMDKLGRVLEYECSQLHIEFQDVLSEMVYPMAANKALTEPVLQKVYGTLESLASSYSFRESAEKEIQNTELWGDSLAHYADRKEDYLEAVRELFSLVLANARLDAAEGPEKTDNENKLEEIRKKYGIEPDDFSKLRRRAMEFFRIAFASHLGIVFQPLRDEAEKFCGPISD